MTTLQASAMNADILRNLGVIACDESLLKRASKYLRKLAREVAADPTKMTQEKFFRQIDEAERDIAEGKGVSFNTVEELDNYIRSL